tara:strand:+ start:2056 stop:2739 length:684 start_codon:yes stop_codon:yes gene_type:complete
MSRLFITKREIDFISDITKEVIKDVVGQRIFYYPVSIVKTQIHDVYEEAVNKVFETPIEIDVLVEFSPEEVKTNIFGLEEIYKLDVFIQHRDLLDKKIKCKEGDFFSYGAIFFEVLSATFINNVFGQTEHYTGIKLIGKQARKGQINMPALGPTSEQYSDANAVQEEFVQQRGFATDAAGDPTGDTRELTAKTGVPLTGPAGVKVYDESDGTTDGNSDSAFYGDGEP